MSKALKRKDVILVTGGAGFIGSHLIKFLRKNFKHKIVCLDLYLPKQKMEGVIYYKADIANYARLKEKWKFIEEKIGGINFVFHLAGLVNVPVSIASPTVVYQVNINGSINIFECCRTSKNIKKILFLSTHSVLYNKSPYAVSKLCCEKIADAYCAIYKLPIIVCRLANVYGPMQTEDAVIPGIISQMLKFDKVKIGNLDSIRDFIFVEDVAMALARIAFKKGNDFLGKIVNVGTGQPISIANLVQTIQGLLGFKGKSIIDIKRLRENDDNYILPDISLLKKTLPFTPKNNLKKGLERTIEYFRERVHEKKY
jgi:dTDP-glucose 4,6-dehydratase